MPDLCSIRSVFFIVLIAELFAFIMALAPMQVGGELRWRNLGLISLFVQWCALLSTAVLCRLRPWLRRFDNNRAGIISYLIVLAIVIIISELTWVLLYEKHIEETMVRHLGFSLRNLAIATIVTGLVLRYFYIQYQWRRQVEAESQARLQALQSRIRPHFLFNSMNTIASLTRSNPQQAEMAVENLADLFRVSLSDARQRLSFREEKELCQRYLEIEQLRLGERLSTQWQADLPNDALLPPLLLQPLLENAIYHGIESRPEGGLVRIEGHQSDGMLSISVTNPLASGKHQDRQQGNQLAQQNVRERLLGIYGNRASLDILESENEYRVEIRFPYLTTHNEDTDR